MTNIRIHALIPAADATSYYRGSGPLNALRKSMRKTVHIEVNQPNVVDWSTQSDCDLMFLQRPCLGKHLTIAQITKQCRTPLWLDFDDDLFNLTVDNPCAATYGNEKIQSNIRKMLELADVVTVSTQAIKDTMQPMTHALVVVIPNAWDDNLRPWTDPMSSRTNRCLWRGSATHCRDVLSVAHHIHDTAELFSDWKFAFMGWEPFMITDKKIGAEIYPKMDILEYVDKLREMAGQILYVPLHESQFNKAKSNCAWLEASYAGYAVLAPEFPEWERPGITVYKGPDDFGQCLQEMLKTPWSQLKERVDASREFIHDHLLLSKVNQLRFAVIERLLAGS